MRLPSVSSMAAVSGRGYNRTVGIFGREKAAFLRRHVAGDVIENVARDGFVLPISGNLECVEISDRKLRLIIKHLFEMRHVPVTIDRVTMEAAPDMIMHSTRSHFAQCKQSHLERMLAGFTVEITSVKPR